MYCMEVGSITNPEAYSRLISIMFLITTQQLVKFTDTPGQPEELE
jgi:hypothetical protein